MIFRQFSVPDVLECIINWVSIRALNDGDDDEKPSALGDWCSVLDWLNAPGRWIWTSADFSLVSVIFTLFLVSTVTKCSVSYSPTVVKRCRR